MEMKRMTWMKAANRGDISPGACLGVSVGGHELALFNVDGCIYATSNICTHQFAYLTDGYMEGEYIECPLHQGRFNVTTGAAAGSPVDKSLRVFPIRVEGESVMVNTGDVG
jgi:nitrite reductase/ring-hydroxylating ferredoxin subunit